MLILTVIMSQNPLRWLAGWLCGASTEYGGAKTHPPYRHDAQTRRVPHKFNGEFLSVKRWTCLQSNKGSIIRNVQIHCNLSKYDIHEMNFSINSYFFNKNLNIDGNELKSDWWSRMPRKGNDLEERNRRRSCSKWMKSGTVLLKFYLQGGIFRNDLLLVFFAEWTSRKVLKHSSDLYCIWLPF